MVLPEGQAGTSLMLPEWKFPCPVGRIILTLEFGMALNDNENTNEAGDCNTVGPV